MKSYTALTALIVILSTTACTTSKPGNMQSGMMQGCQMGCCKNMQKNSTMDCCKNMSGTSSKMMKSTPQSMNSQCSKMNGGGMMQNDNMGDMKQSMPQNTAAPHTMQHSVP